MDEIKRISKEEIQEIAGTTGFNQSFIIKDYYLTLILYLLRNIQGLYFKGGTALQKIYLSYSRLSEDVDYTVTKDINLIKREIYDLIESSGYFEKINKDKDVDDFTRLIVHYRSPFNDEGNVFIDLNKRAKLILKPELKNVPHFYSNIPKFKTNILNLKEMIAEKISATIRRNKPRDHFDVYRIIENRLPIDLELVRKKCNASGQEFSIIRMFKNANKLKIRWDNDLIPLVRDEISFQQVMISLSKFFEYKERKRKLREDKKD